MPGEFAPGEMVLLCLRGEDIEIRHPSELSSDRLRYVQINGKIETLSPWMAQFRVTIRTGEQILTVFLSKSRLGELRLQEGDAVVACFAAADAHLIRNSSPNPFPS